MQQAAISQSERLLARLLACYDYRLPEEREEIKKRSNYSEKHVNETLRKLRKIQYELWAQHIRDIRAIGLATIVVETRKTLEDVETVNDLERIGMPWARYFYSYRHIMGTKRVYSYLAPIKYIEEMMNDLESYFPQDSRLEAGFVVPIRFNCDNMNIDQPIDDEAVEKAEKALQETPPRIRYGLLEVFLYARLDMAPLAGIRELQEIAPVLQERINIADVPLRLKRRKLQQSLERLSSMKLLGRALLARATWPDGSLVPLYLEVRRDCASRLYAIAATLWSSPSIFVGSETAATVLVLPDERSAEVEKLLGDCVLAHGFITQGVGTVIPVEMFSPKEGWSTKRQPVEKLFWGLGLAEKKS